jgi:hypothetical protein
MKRREVLRIGSLIVLLPAATRLLVACGGDNGNGNGNGDAGLNGADGGTQRLTFTSSVDQAHQHTVALEPAELSTPPAAGVTKNTSLDAGHLHTVELSEAELADIDGGGTVTKTTSLVSGHTHTFAFSRP